MFQRVSCITGLATSVTPTGPQFSTGTATGSFKSSAVASDVAYESALQKLSTQRKIGRVSEIA